MENVLEIEVTRRDLKQPYGSPSNCPIATALKRTFNTSDVNVSSRNLEVNGMYYHIRPEDDKKAQMRGDGKLLGRLLGGFKVVLHKIHWT